jgi:hypothetical protein
MNIPAAIVAVISKEEAEQLAKFYGTDLYKPFLARLKEKYKHLHEFLKREDEDLS